jgi:TonB family protein
MMSDLWKRWEGVVADNRYTLRQFLGNTGHSAVFLTSLPGPDAGSAVIKFISAEIPGAHDQLSNWTRASQLTHPNILRLHHSGHCRIQDMDLLYTVSEFAEENLGQFLPSRPLTAEEASDMLTPIVEALVSLHAAGLAHGHIKPSNILAIGDRLKLSSDTILPFGQTRSGQRERDVYDAPETVNEPVHAAADVWSLGVTLVEALTQHAPGLPYDDESDPAIPQYLPQPYLEIGYHALRRDADKRWTCAEIAAHLNPAIPTAAAAGATVAPASPLAAPSAPAIITTPSVASSSSIQPSPAPLTPAPLSSVPLPPSTLISPLSVPLSREPAVPLAKFPHPHTQLLHSVPADSESSNSSVTLPHYFVPLALGVALLIGIILAVPHFFHHVASSPVSASSTSPASANSSQNQTREAPSAPSPASSAIVTPAPEKTFSKPAEESRDSKPLASVDPVPAPAVPPAETKTDHTPYDMTSNNGEVLDQVLPQASQKALHSIQGTVRVVVLAHVDPSGQVSSAEIDSPGPSKYFANLAQQAARRWVFSTPQSGSHSASSDWRIRFEFSSSGVHAFPQQLATRPN